MSAIASSRILYLCFLMRYFFTLLKKDGHRVVPAVAPAANARLEVVPAAEAPTRITSILRTLIRVNQCAAWSSATDRDQDGTQHQISRDRRACGSADDPAREQIHDDRQIQPTLPRPNVRDIRYPGPVAARPAAGAIVVRSTRTIQAHQTRNAPLAGGFTRFTQFLEQPWRFADTFTCDERGADQPQQPSVLLCPLRCRVLQSVVAATPRDLEQAAHHCGRAVN